MGFAATTASVRDKLVVLEELRSAAKGVLELELEVDER